MTTSACAMHAAPVRTGNVAAAELAQLTEKHADLQTELQALRLEKDAAVGAADSLRVERDRLLSDTSFYKETVDWYDSQITKLTAAAAPAQITKAAAYSITDSPIATVLAVPGEILFDSGASSLSQSGNRQIAEIAALIRKDYSGRTIRVEGHADTDSVRAGARFTSNWDISARRAVAVVEALEKAGVDPRRLSIAAFGQHRPRPEALGKSAADKQRNRRVEIAILK
jgi:chemotaxis protein MotB